MADTALTSSVDFFYRLLYNVFIDHKFVQPTETAQFGNGKERIT